MTDTDTKDSASDIVQDVVNAVAETELEKVAKPFKRGDIKPKDRVRNIKSGEAILKVPLTKDKDDVASIPNKEEAVLDFADKDAVEHKEDSSNSEDYSHERTDEQVSAKEEHVQDSVDDSEEEEGHKEEVSSYLLKKLHRQTAQKKALEEQLARLQGQALAPQSHMLMPQQAQIYGFDSDDHFVDPITGQKYARPRAADYGTDVARWLEMSRSYEKAREMAKQQAYKVEAEKVRNAHLVNTYQKKISDGFVKYPDLPQKMQTPLLQAFDQVHMRASQKIMEMDNAADVTYALVSSPEVMSQLLHTSTDDVLVFLGTLSRELEAKMKPRTSKAPQPIGAPKETQVKGAGSPVAKSKTALTEQEEIRLLRQKDKRRR